MRDGAAIHGAAFLLEFVSASHSWKTISLYVAVALAALFIAAIERTTVISFVRNSWPDQAERQLYQELAPYRRM